jgi:hypothetical protein
MASAGRALPVEWLPAGNRGLLGRPAVFGAARWRIGDADAEVIQHDTRAVLRGPMPDGRVLEIAANDDGAAVVWGDDVMSSFSRGLTVIAVSPGPEVIGRWTFDASEPVEMPLAPTLFAVRRGPAPLPALPASGELDVSSANDALFGDGWFAAERGGTQRFRWGRRSAVLRLPVAVPAPLSLVLRLRAAHPGGANLTAAIGGGLIGACALPPGRWIDCRFDLPATALHAGINEVVLASDSVMPAEHRGADPRELAVAIQTSRVKG